MCAPEASPKEGAHAGAPLPHITGAFPLYSATVGLAELASANIVGYNTVTLKKGYNMIAVNFEDVVIGL